MATLRTLHRIFLSLTFTVLFIILANIINPADAAMRGGYDQALMYLFLILLAFCVFFFLLIARKDIRSDEQRNSSSSGRRKRKEKWEGSEDPKYGKFTVPGGIPRKDVQDSFEKAEELKNALDRAGSIPRRNRNLPLN